VELRIKAALGIIRRLRARFRRVLEPPSKIVYIGEGNFVMTVDMSLEPLTATETRLELVMQLSASFLVESALNYRINLALEDFGVRLQEAIVKARAAFPAAEAVPRVPTLPEAEAHPTPVAGEQASAAESKAPAPSIPEPSGDLEALSERLADVLIVSELLLNSKHIRTVRTKLESPENLASLVRDAARDRDYIYVAISMPSKGYLARIIMYKGRIIAATLEAGGSVKKGEEALEAIREAGGVEAEVNVLEPPPDTISRIVS
jgi:hypothetical protein